MKPLITFFTFIISLNAFSQDVKQQLFGEWKVVSVDNGEVYYNWEKDSVSVSDEFKERLEDPESSNLLIQLVKTMYPNKFIFSSTAVTQTSNLETSSRSYTIDEKRHLIILKDRNSLGNETPFEMSFRISDKLLYLNMPLTDSETKFVLKKIGP
ncbi:hypothetical protein WG906_04455 [Pedobacter sp. P351]|uniref:hypothetical protein n=1 Tax=Pedobacter superstes TaxID=3133441 RepID=UPI0030B195D0